MKTFLWILELMIWFWKMVIMSNLVWQLYSLVWKLIKVVVLIVDRMVLILIGKVNQLLQRVVKVPEVMTIIHQVQSISTASLSDFWFLWQVFRLCSFRTFFLLSRLCISHPFCFGFCLSRPLVYLIFAVSTYLHLPMSLFSPSLSLLHSHRPQYRLSKCTFLPFPLSPTSFVHENECSTHWRMFSEWSFNLSTRARWDLTLPPFRLSDREDEKKIRISSQAWSTTHTSTWINRHCQNVESFISRIAFWTDFICHSKEGKIVWKVSGIAAGSRRHLQEATSTGRGSRPESSNGIVSIEIDNMG